MSTDTAPRPNLEAVRDAPVGGQAVLEGVMMRGVSTWAVAVRKPAPEDAPEDSSSHDGSVPVGDDGELARSAREAPLPALGEISVESFPLTSVLRKHRALRLPVIRGV